MSDVRQRVAAGARRLSEGGLAVGSTGNLSLREGDTVWITRSAGRGAHMQARDVVAIDLQGRRLYPEAAEPSSEWALHTEIYRLLPNAGAVVHCHSRYATALACQRRALPPFHYMVLALGGRQVPCADYATFGTEKLAHLATQALLPGQHACLLANHGQLTLGPDLETALDRAELLEELAATYLAAVSSGTVTLLNEAELAAAQARFADYGQG